MRRAQEFSDELTSISDDPRNLDGCPDLLGFALEDLTSAIAALRPEARALILAFYFKGKGTDEIAEALSIRRGDVKVRLYRARRRLRKYLINPREVCDG
jgi:DNA-directed RNA polymerase specialized sigma24 family protein